MFEAALASKALGSFRVEGLGFRGLGFRCENVGLRGSRLLDA